MIKKGTAKQATGLIAQKSLLFNKPHIYWEIKNRFGRIMLFLGRVASAFFVLMCISVRLQLHLFRMKILIEEKSNEKHSFNSIVLPLFIIIISNTQLLNAVCINLMWNQHFHCEDVHLYIYFFVLICVYIFVVFGLSFFMQRV